MSRRQRGRELAFQLLFQTDQTGDKINAVVARFTDLRTANADAAAFAESLAVGAFKKQEELDQQISAVAQNWKLSRLLSVDRAVLRLSAYELFHTLTPTEVVLDEGIELAKHFGSDESGAFVNGVLDKLSAVARPIKPAPKKRSNVGAGLVPAHPAPGSPPARVAKPARVPKIIVGKSVGKPKSTPIPKKKSKAA
jgi:N utilization substance protein B